jgi:hypothetical protein
MMLNNVKVLRDYIKLLHILLVTFYLTTDTKASLLD